MYAAAARPAACDAGRLGDCHGPAHLRQLSGHSLWRAQRVLFASYLLPLNGALKLAHRTDGKISTEQIWRQNNPDFSRTRRSDHSVAVDPSGRPFIAHTTPDGIVLEIRDDQGKWTQERLIGEALPPTLVSDANGKLHVFYWTISELRHVFEGHCPN